VLILTRVACNISGKENAMGTYRIAGKFGEEFNLANWRGIEKIVKLKIAQV